MIFINNNLSVGSKSSITKVSSGNYTLNGTGGTHYYYCTVGKFAFVFLNVYCSSANGAALTKIGSGLPKAKYDNMLFSMSCESYGYAMIAYIDTSGNLFVRGGVTNNYYYATCVYPIA